MCQTGAGHSATMVPAAQRSQPRRQSGTASLGSSTPSASLSNVSAPALPNLRAEAKVGQQTTDSNASSSPARHSGVTEQPAVKSKQERRAEVRRARKRQRKFTEQTDSGQGTAEQQKVSQKPVAPVAKKAKPPRQVQRPAQSGSTGTPKPQTPNRGNSSQVGSRRSGVQKHGKSVVPPASVARKVEPPREPAKPLPPLTRAEAFLNSVSGKIRNLTGSGGSGSKPASAKPAMQLNDRASSERAIKAVLDNVERDLKAKRDPGQENVVRRLMKLVWNKNNLGDLRNTAALSQYKEKILAGLKEMFGDDYDKLNIPEFLKK
jgi:hypothetical protein